MRGGLLQIFPRGLVSLPNSSQWFLPERTQPLLLFLRRKRRRYISQYISVNVSFFSEFPLFLLEPVDLLGTAFLLSSVNLPSSRSSFLSWHRLCSSSSSSSPSPHDYFCPSPPLPPSPSRCPQLTSCFVPFCAPACVGRKSKRFPSCSGKDRALSEPDLQEIKKKKKTLQHLWGLCVSWEKPAVMNWWIMGNMLNRIRMCKKSNLS